MRMRWLGGWFLVLVLGLSGCRSKVETVEVAPEDTTTHLGDTIEISLADWLKLPRPELAKLVAEWTETVGKERQAARDTLESVQLLPQLHPPAAAVVFADAHFSPTAGFSLPPYVKEGQKDAAVALHLARFGDREAALKLADAADAELLGKIDAYRGEHNYPLEWTRLTGLVLEHAQLKLANGEPEGATELVLLHRQLHTVLDAKAAASPLGAALLPRGRQALTLAAAAWREPRRNKTALAADIDAVLTEWGKTPDTTPSLAAGAQQTEVARLFNSPVVGRAIIAHDPSTVQRTLDLLTLPLPAEGVGSVVAFLNDKQILTELIVLYRPKINELFPDPGHLALALVEHGYPSQTTAAGPGLNRQTWTGGGQAFEVDLLTRGNAGGALVRVTPAGAPAPSSSFARNPRNFGAVNFDRSYEQNRLGLAPEQNSTPLEINSKDQLALITQPAADFALSGALLRRETSHDLLAQADAALAGQSERRRPQPSGAAAVGRLRAVSPRRRRVIRRRSVRPHLGGQQHAPETASAV